MNTHTRINAPTSIAQRPFTYADLVAQAKAVFPGDYKPSRKVGLSSVGSYSVAELRSAHIAMNLTPAMRLELSLARMVDIQTTAYPDHWPESDKREVAAKHLFAAVEDEQQGRVG